MGNSYLEIRRDYEAKKGVFEMVCAQFEAKRKYLENHDDVLKEMLGYVDIIIDNTRYTVKNVEMINKERIDIKKVLDYTKLLMAVSNMLHNSTIWTNEALLKISSYKFLLDSGETSKRILDAPLLRLRNELKSLVGPTVCNTTTIYHATQNLL